MVLNRAQASPDGNWVLVQQLRRPYSYQVPLERFAQSVEVWNLVR